MTEHMDEATKVLTEGIEAGVNTPDDVNALLAKLMHANLVDYQNTTGMLIENYQNQIADLEATLRAIRRRVSDLFGGPYMPTESAIIQAVFYPSKDLIDQCRRDNEES